MMIFVFTENVAGGSGTLVPFCYFHRVLDAESMEFLDTSSGLWLWSAFRPGFG